MHLYHLYLYYYLYQWYLFLHAGKGFCLVFFHFTLKNCPCKSHQLMMNSLRFDLSWNMFISPSTLKHRFFFFNLSTYALGIIFFDYIHVYTLFKAVFKKIFILFICAYNVCVISPPLPLHYPAEPILPLSVILLKREYKQ
jgi:hypothetical protein